MKLSSLELSNFRCLERLQMAFLPDVTVLVGNNGAGKTAILDATAYAMSRFLTRMPGIEGRNLRPEDIRLPQ